MKEPLYLLTRIQAESAIFEPDQKKVVVKNGKISDKTKLFQLIAVAIYAARNIPVIKIIRASF